MPCSHVTLGIRAFHQMKKRMARDEAFNAAARAEIEARRKDDQRRFYEALGWFRLIGAARLWGGRDFARFRLLSSVAFMSRGVSRSVM